MLFKGIIAVYSENHTKPVNKIYRFQIVKMCGMYNYHWPFKGLNSELNFNYEMTLFMPAPALFR
jgi:hypothetical protein